MVGWPLAAPRFEEVEVPHANLLGSEGDGFKLAMRVFDQSRPAVGAQSVGIGQGAIEHGLASLQLFRGRNVLHLFKEHADMEAKIEPPEDWVDPTPPE